jgi:hypothetical protein
MLQVLVLPLKFFTAEKEAWAMQKLFTKERIEKMDKCPND